MLKTSNYNIFIPIKDECIIVNGCSGAFDLVDKNIYTKLKEAQKDNNKLLEIN